MEEDTQHHAEPQKQQQQQEALEPGYLSVFLLKYLCPNEGCGGTMAPVHGSSSSSSGGEVCECSVCGALRTEAQFLAELQQ
jgi:SET and MYND domain-containing protein